MTRHLHDRQHYEDRYDKTTVEIGRREADSFLRARAGFYEQAKTTDKEEKAKMEFWWTRLYWWLVEVPTLVERWENKQATVEAWMAEDRAADERLAEARPHIEPACSYCGKQGLRLKLKELIHRGSGGKQAVLFMFDCGSCKKRSAFWEDGSEWESPVIPCPKCTAELTMEVKETPTTITTILSCSVCGHTDVDKIRMNKKEKPDPNFARDKKLFCLTDERGRQMQEYRQKWQEACRMMDGEKEKVTKKEVYDVVSQINLIKVADLISLLQPAVEAAGFIELSFEKPQIYREFSISFSCLDKDTSRTDSRSRAALKKAIVKTFKETNWRLMSDGISYRLGYLSGRVRAYESEQDLVKLTEKEAKS